MKRALTLLLAMSMLLTFGLFAFAEDSDALDPELEGLLGQTTAPQDTLDPAVKGAAESLGLPDMSILTDLLGGISLDTLTSVLGDTASSMGVPDLSALFGGGLADMEVVSLFTDTIGGFLEPMGINLQDALSDSVIFSFFSKLYTGVYTGGAKTTVPTAVAAPEIPEPEPTPDDTTPSIPDTGVGMDIALVAMGVLVVAVGAAFVLRKKKVEA
ncbi:MAG: LPXTG cell wall anchor domain-containing protein [Oscillospiraceae bacterium]|jgi:LPXTG-motif cell wall-anchored protein|nr:LPXTG cell wall anchor domain-containing protein [Oscillospiraceae bacterium]